MKILFFTCVFLVSIINTVSPNKNASKELQNSNVTANKNWASFKKIKKRERYNNYVDPELQKIWEMYLAQVPISEVIKYKTRTRRTYKWTPAMKKETAVTEIYKALRERGNNIGRKAVSNINLTPTPGARPYRIGKNRTVNVINEAFREKGNNIGKEVVSNINLTPTPGARPYRIGKNRTVNVINKAFRERGNNTGREAVSNINLIPTPGARPHRIGKNRTVNVINKAFRERGNNTGREAVSNINLTPIPGAQPHRIGKNRTVNVINKALRERGNNIGRKAVSNINLTPTPGARPYRIGKNRTVNVMRRKATKFYTEEKDYYEPAILAEVRGDKDKLKFEGFREPYWPGGDYVFLRTGSPSTPAPQGYFDYYAEITTLNLIEAFRGCDRSCNYYFRSYGRVCGHRYNMKHFSNYYKEFDNICDMDHENCKDIWMRPMWHPLHKGNCPEKEPIATMVYDYYDVVARGYQYGNYDFTPRRGTPATPDLVDQEIARLQG